MYGNYTGYGMNPYQQQLAQNRLNQMEQQYGNGMYQQSFQTQQQMQQLQMQILKGRPVSSYDEAKASMIDLDGSLFVFTDVANKRIYTKQIMLDGSAELKTYVLEEQPITQTQQTGQQNSDMYVLKTEFEKAMEQMNMKINSMMEVEAYESNGNDVKSNVRK